jgi:chromatin structure-remodeling complex subunit RSC1/2
LVDELKQLHARGYIDSPTLPDLGPIPASSPVSARSGTAGASTDESDSDSDSEESDEDVPADGEEEDEYAEKGATKEASARASKRTRTRRTKEGSGSPSPSDKKEESGVQSEETPKPDAAAVPAKKRKRGRPPKIDTPEEARIRSVLRAIRKVKDKDGRQLFLEFEKLPDQEQYPDYFKEIKRPIALDNITVPPRLLD